MPAYSAIRPRLQNSVGVRGLTGSANFHGGCCFPSSMARAAVWKARLVAFVVTLLLSAGMPARGAAGGGQGKVAGGTKVTGTVSTGDGNLPSMIALQLRTTHGSVVQSSSAGASGAFSFEHVPPASYLIVVCVPGYEPVTLPVEVGHTPIAGLSIMLTLHGYPHANGEFQASFDTASVRQPVIPKRALNEYDRAVRSEERGKIDDAIKHWKKSIKFFPPFAESYMQLSEVYADRSDFTRATEAADHAIAIDTKSADPYEFLGFVYAKEKDFPKAEEAFAQAVRLSDSQWLSQFWLGKLLLNEKDAQGAYPHLLRAFLLNPRIPDVDIALYDDLLMLGRPKDALAKLDDFIARFPNSPLAAKARAQRDRLAKSLGQKEH